VIARGRSELGHRHFDVAGALLVTGGFSALVYGIVRTDALSWGAPGVLVPIAVGVVLLAGFALVEGRVAEAPLVPLRIFARPRLRAANLVVLALYCAVFAMWFFLSLYLQQIHHLSAIGTGLLFLPMTLGVALASNLAPRLTKRVGARPTIFAGMAASATGLLMLSALRPYGSYLPLVLPGGILAAAGLGLTLVPSTIVAVEGVPGSEAGLASGLLNTSRLLGGALGLAVLTTIANVHSRAPAALTHGYDRAFLAGGLICLAGALAAYVMLGEREGRPRLLALLARLR
jgi:predicted MFS family arabinose efflux permease